MRPHWTIVLKQGTDGGIDSKRMIGPVVLACDNAYLMPLATTLRSIVEANHLSWPVKVHVLSDGISESSRRKVLNSLPDGSASIHWRPVDLAAFRDFSTIYYVSKMTYTRLLIPTLFPDTISRVLYLDTDLLVLDDLTPLWETDLNGSVIGAVLDSGIDLLLKPGEPLSQQMPRVQEYFNAGVLLIDLERWRQNHISEKALAYLASHPHSPCMDQDGLNFACDRLWEKLDSRWNFQDHLHKSISQIPSEQRPGIVHFVTCRKPWNPSLPSRDAGFYDVFRSRTCFARTPLDKLLDRLRRFWAHVKDDLKRCTFWKLSHLFVPVNLRKNRDFHQEPVSRFRRR
jgi:lipopolysaccharide biosynthesis glycosyltransferase